MPSSVIVIACETVFDVDDDSEKRRTKQRRPTVARDNVTSSYVRLTSDRKRKCDVIVDSTYCRSQNAMRRHRKSYFETLRFGTRAISLGHGHNFDNVGQWFGQE